MEGEQFSLCWNNFHRNLSSGFNSLLQDEDLVDVTLAAEGRYIKAHKTVLSVCSPYFKELFRVNPCKHPIVILSDINYSALSNLLQFMYQGEVSVSQEEIATFMRVAETLKVKGLTDNAGNTESNGIEGDSLNRSSPQTFGSSSELRPNSSAIRRTRPVRKLIKPIQHLKPIELTSSKSPPKLKSPQPPAKKQCFEEQMAENLEYPVRPKQEPVDHDVYRENNHNSRREIPSLANETTNVPIPSRHESPNWTGDFKKDSRESIDVTTPGTLQCILGKRGNPRLIVDGHTFFKKSTYKGKSFWYCKQCRSSYKCPAVCWTLNGNIIKWPSQHTHQLIADIFNPEDDTEVPIKHLQEVLIQAAGLIFLKSRKGHPVLIHDGHMYTLSHKIDNTSTWMCVKNRILNCQGCITTTSGPMIVSHSGHNHAQLNDIIPRLQASSCSPSPELL